MLDTTTKRRIDTARDILVGKVPDPKSQVEQITIALIYKFMDDMDAESEELGGSRSFFANGFSKYGWAKLMRSGLGGHETLNLYAEAIAKMPENPGVPALFRSIFKNAFLPYRDPETLKSFLKIIDEFEYDHSERLGDAFEYLLSVLGSQGDAGQFRTPRHIIDFMVKVIDPKKHEKILDPACGTAGFLISSYKHILQHNRETPLTPSERETLASNIKGYDISPDMVRLSLVNLYLHGFNDPHIEEYDTLTSQDKWNEYADVILANPPFMSPKGGIKPHNRFTVQSKRSEVLFVDYMAEHLTPTGRAAIIVPEGIIFQSGKAYKELRKMLVENSLVAVISLPAGVFQPYSGVKTSILILDKSLARQSKSIGFFKVENDGFALGAQRRPIDKNDLPDVLSEIRQFMIALQKWHTAEDLAFDMGLAVAKERIAENGEYNLSGERYRVNSLGHSLWPFVRIGDVFIKSDKAIVPQNLTGPVVYLGLENIVSNIGDLTGNVFIEDTSEIKSLKNTFKAGHILYGKLRPNLNKVWYSDRDGICSTDIFVLEGIKGKVEPRLYAYLLRTSRFNHAVLNQIRGAQLPRVGWDAFSNLEIPLPPLEIQKEIVSEIEGYQKIIDGARAVVDNYKPHIPIDPEWSKTNLSSLAHNLDSKRIPITKSDRKTGSYPYYGASGIVDYVSEYIFDDDILLISEDGANLLARSIPIAFSVTGKCWVNNHAHVLRFKNIATQKFVEIYINSISVKEFVTGAAQPKLNQEALNRILIPIPDNIEIQQSIVAEIEAEQALVNANRELIERFEKKIQKTIARVWGEEQREEKL